MYTYQANGGYENSSRVFPGNGWGLSASAAYAVTVEGVLYVPGELCFGDNPPGNTVRLSYGVLSPEALAEAGARFVRAARKING
jgi:2-aminoadipate transaminase